MGEWRGERYFTANIHWGCAALAPPEKMGGIVGRRGESEGWRGERYFNAASVGVAQRSRHLGRQWRARTGFLHFLNAILNSCLFVCLRSVGLWPLPCRRRHAATDASRRTSGLWSLIYRHYHLYHYHHHYRHLYRHHYTRLPPPPARRVDDVARRLMHPGGRPDSVGDEPRELTRG